MVAPAACRGGALIASANHADAAVPPTFLIVLAVGALAIVGGVSIPLTMWALAVPRSRDRALAVLAWGSIGSVVATGLYLGLLLGAAAVVGEAGRFTVDWGVVGTVAMAGYGAGVIGSWILPSFKGGWR